jgi:hypothetical protein
MDILLFFTVAGLTCSSSFGFFCNLVTYYDYEMLVCAYAALFLVTIILFV